MKRFFLILFLFFVPLSQIRAEEIMMFRSAYDIRTDGTVGVTETIVYDFGTEQRRGIIREIPRTKTNTEGKQFRLDFTKISVTNEQGTQYTVQQTTDDTVLKLRIGDPDVYITGSHTYVISYVVSGALTYFSDHDELYWNATGNGWNVPVKQAISTVTLPQVVDPPALRLQCFTGPSGSTATDCLTTHDGQTVTITSNSVLSTNEGMTFVVGFPKDIAAVLEPVPVTSVFDNPFFVIGFIAAMAAWYIFLPVYIGIRWWRQGRDPKPTIGQAHVWFSAPKMPDGQPMKPAELSFLLHEFVDSRSMTGTIIDLAHKGYLHIKKEGDTIWLEKKQQSNGSELTSYEKELYDGIFSSGDKVEPKDVQLYTVFQKIKTDLPHQAVQHKLFVKNPQLQRMFYSGIAGLGLITGNIPLLISSVLFGMHMPKKTQTGANLAAMAKALKTFLVSQDDQYQFQAKEVLLFEKMLPYATALGIERIWANRFKHLTVPPPEWYSGSDPFSPSMFTHTLSSSFRPMQTSMTTTSSSSGFSSGFSGGSSGGGGGGGGGGSW